MILVDRLYSGKCEIWITFAPGDRVYPFSNRISIYKKIEQHMSLQCGIIGLANTGKTTLFQLHVECEGGNFPVCLYL